MSHKLKALGLGLLAAMAVSAFAVMNASAESQATGHFTSSVVHTNLGITEGPGEAHRFELLVEGLTGIVCDEAAYTSTINAATVTDLTVSGTYAKCHTTGGSPGEVTVTMNGCTYTFTQPNKVAATTEHTVDLVCPAGKLVEVHHPSCTSTIGPVAGLKSVGYTTTLEGKHSITVTAAVKGFTTQFHGGICNLLGTNHPSELKGSATVKGFNTAGEQVDITATGSTS